MNISSVEYEGLMLPDTISFYALFPPVIWGKNSCSLRHCGVLAQLCLLTWAGPLWELDGVCMVISLFSSCFPSLLTCLGSLEKSPELFFCWIVAQWSDSGLCIKWRRACVSPHVCQHFDIWILICHIESVGSFCCCHQPSLPCVQKPLRYTFHELG